MVGWKFGQNKSGLTVVFLPPRIVFEADAVVCKLTAYSMCVAVSLCTLQWREENFERYRQQLRYRVVRRCTGIQRSHPGYRWRSGESVLQGGLSPCRVSSGIPLRHSGDEIDIEEGRGLPGKPGWGG